MSRLQTTLLQNTCLTTAIASGETTTIVSPIVTPAVSISCDHVMPVCVNTKVILTANPVSGQGSSPIYTWWYLSDESGWIFVESGTTIEVTVTNDINYKCIMTSNATCKYPNTGEDIFTLSFSPTQIVYLDIESVPKSYDSSTP